MLNLGTLLVVEDEPLISIMIEDMAKELGWRIDGLAYNQADALDLLKIRSPSVAVLDIDLGPNGDSLPVARACRERGIPVLFTTGYTPDNVPSECGSAPILSKPFSTEEFEHALLSVGSVSRQAQGYIPG